tara:strand:+ start:4351 stop:4749 length:399 start_codon:yes stop_codon:yes gene_type:complete
MVTVYYLELGDKRITSEWMVNYFITIAVIFLLFYRLKVKVQNKTLKIYYEIGLIHFTFKMDEITKVESIKTPWYYGYGIRLTPDGWLYNAHGSQALEIKYMYKGKNKSVMIGTPEPEELKKALLRDINNTTT